ncbi:MAG: cytochrome P450 [Chloroflexi bacterium]|nr:cytochrome P450 [Chloroflexota bacterium]
MQIPTPTPQAGLRALRALLRQRSPLAALESFHAELGDVFRPQLPSFSPVVLVGPEAGRFVLVSAREDFRWRVDNDPVTHLLRYGVLVVDGEQHDTLRRQMNPALHKRMLSGYVQAMLRATDQVCAAWQPGETRDMLVEMRKIALLIIMETLYQVDFTPQLRPLWHSVLRTIQYISPGLWLIWRGTPRPGYQRHLKQMDTYLYRIIRARRATLGATDDLLGALIDAGLDDGLIRDQLLTMLIAGHDTSTALLAWALHLLGQHPAALERARAEVRAVFGESLPDAARIAELRFMDNVLDETLRLYPPIHLSSRVAAADMQFNGYDIAAGARVLFSIYLTQRHPAYWPAAAAFVPERHAQKPAPYTFLPFGGGPRNCIGAAFAQVESKMVLARLLQRFELRAAPDQHVHAHMGATLEPRPGVRLRIIKRLPADSLTGQT